VIRDTIAPKISDTLTATARRVDVPVPPVVEVTSRRRHWLKVGAGTALLAAAGAAAAFVLLRRRNDGTGEAPGKQPRRAPACRPHKTVSCELAPTAVARKTTSPVISRRPNPGATSPW
jgi:hypothetical protein